MWTDTEKNATFRGMRRVRQLATLVVTGKKQLQMFCSIAGLGKTETVLEVFSENDLTPHYSSPTSAEGLCQDLWLHRDAPYFLDDCDRLARSEPCANIAKMAYGPQRLVVVPLSLKIQKNEEHRLNDSHHYNANVPPPTFKLGPRHGLLWNSNKNFTLPEMVTKEMAADFAAQVSRGLDPYWIPDRPQDVFDYTIWMVMNGMLRRHRQGGRSEEGGFKLQHQQEVLAFLCQNARRLPEVTPRMAWKLAMTRRHDPEWEQGWRELLLPHVRWPIELPDNVPLLISPKMRRAEAPEPPSSEPDPSDPDPPEPPAPSDPDPPAPEPPTPLDERPIPPSEPPTGTQQRSMWSAVDLIYRQGQQRTCESVADVLRQCAPSEWDADDIDRLREALESAADWYGDHNGMAQTLFCYETSPILYGTASGVIIYEDQGLKVLTWSEAMERIAPEVAESQRKHELARRRDESQRIIRTKLPAKRKLKAMKSLLDEVMALQPPLNQGAERAIDYIRRMMKDDERFADCVTFNHYVRKAADLADVKAQNDADATA